MPTGHSRQLSQLCQKKLDTAHLTIGGVRNLFIEMETRPRTEQFKPHIISDGRRREEIDTFHRRQVLKLQNCDEKRLIHSYPSPVVEASFD